MILFFRKSLHPLLESLVLLSLLLMAQTVSASAQAVDVFEKPAKFCGVLRKEDGFVNIIASDNKINTIYYYSNKKLHSQNIYTGEIEWSTDISEIYKGLYITEDKTLYYISNKDISPSAEHDLVSLSLNTGLINWRVRLEDPRALILSADRKTIIVQNRIDQIFAVSTLNDIQWKKQFPFELEFIEKFSEGQLLIIGKESLSKINEKNSLDFETKSIRREILKDLTAVTNDKNSIYFGDQGGTVKKLSDNKLEVLWSYRTGAKISALKAVESGLLVFSLDNFVYLFNKDSGRIIWKKRIDSRIINAPLISRNYAFLSSAQGNKIYVLDIKDGQIKNQLEVGDGVYILGKPQILNDELIISTTGGLLRYSFSGCQK